MTSLPLKEQIAAWREANPEVKIEAAYDPDPVPYKPTTTDEQRAAFLRMANSIFPRHWVALAADIILDLEHAEAALRDT